MLGRFSSNNILSISSLLFGTQMQPSLPLQYPETAIVLVVDPTHGSTQELPVCNPVGVTLLPQNTNCILLLTALNQSQSTPGCGRYCVSCASLYVTKLSITISINIKIKKKPTLLWVARQTLRQLISKSFFN